MTVLTVFLNFDTKIDRESNKEQKVLAAHMVQAVSTPNNCS